MNINELIAISTAEFNIKHDENTHIHSLLNMATIKLKNLVREYPQFIGCAEERTASGYKGIRIYVFDNVRRIALDTNVVVKGMRTPLTDEQRTQLHKTLERLRHEQN